MKDDRRVLIGVRGVDRGREAQEDLPYSGDVGHSGSWGMKCEVRRSGDEAGWLGRCLYGTKEFMLYILFVHGALKIYYAIPILRNILNIKTYGKHFHYSLIKTQILMSLFF